MFAYACHASPRPTEDVVGVPGEGGQARRTVTYSPAAPPESVRRASPDSSSNSRLARCCWPWPASHSPAAGVPGKRRPQPARRLATTPPPQVRFGTVEGVRTQHGDSGGSQEPVVVLTSPWPQSMYARPGSSTPGSDHMTQPVSCPGPVRQRARGDLLPWLRVCPSSVTRQRNAGSAALLRGRPTGTG
jgi:hypothetical protein